jgi:small subunit ribosomal protein S12
LVTRLTVDKAIVGSSPTILPMSTINQIIKRPKIKKDSPSGAPALAGAPQAKGICLRVFIKKPRKPNSAQRKMARIKLTLTGKIVNAYIPGIGHNLEQFNVVMIRGGRTKDLPGVKYKCIRGKFDLAPVIGRKTARSKYGVSRN